MKGKIKLPGIGFYFSAAALVFSVAGMCLFLVTYNVGGYTLSRWALTCSVLAVWLLLFITVNMFIKGDKPFWCSLLFVLAVFLLTYGLLKFIQPCLTPIGFVFGASDLNMGDTALNKVVAYYSVATAAFYVLSVLSILAAAFLPETKKNRAQLRRHGGVTEEGNE